MKIQRFEGVEGYGDRTLHMGGYSEKKQTYRNIKLCLLAALCLCLFSALETTLLSRIPLLILPAGSPSLCLIFVLASGYLFGEKEGCVCGLLGGIMTECAVMEPWMGGIMIYPLVYCLLGYTSGALSKHVLAENLPSFMVYALIGKLADCLIHTLFTVVSIHGLPPIAYFWGSLLPDLILTVIFSPLGYLLVRAGKKIFDKT